MEKICFLVGSIGISGGTYVIIQHADYLREQGYEVVMAIQSPFNLDTIKWHDKAKYLGCIPFNDAKLEEYDLVIATWWKTAIHLHEFQSKHFAYFVQSIESKFYPSEQASLRQYVDDTYKLPVHIATEATWIKEYLAQHFQQDSFLIKNGIRKDIYNTINMDVRRDFRVLVEGHFGVPFKNTALAIKLAKEAGVKDIWVLTGSPVKWLPGINKLFSRIPMSETADIYNKCDLIIKLSTVEGMFGPPLEMFHCGGTAIVFNVSGHDEYIVDDYNACVVKNYDIDEVVKIIRELKDDTDKLEKLKSGALATAKNWPDWGQSSEKFAFWVKNIIGETYSPSNFNDIIKMNYESEKRYKSSVYENSRDNKKSIFFILAKKVFYLIPTPIKSVIKQLQAIFEVFSQKRDVK